MDKRYSKKLVILFPLVIVSFFSGLKYSSKILSYIYIPKTTSTSVQNDKKKMLEAYGQAPLNFVMNQGQTNNKVKYISRGGGYNFFLTQTGAIISLSKHSTEKEFHASIQMSLIGANTQSVVTPIDPLSGVVNSFSGKDKTKWHQDVPSYAKVQYKEIYDGIDLVYYGNQNYLEYDFIVSPGTDPKKITFNYNGADKIEKNMHGDLVLYTQGEQIRLHKPNIYQTSEDHVRHRVAGEYLLAKNTVQFKIGEYDSSLPLTIDPVLDYSTFLGGSGNDDTKSIFVDSSGNAYITGETTSTDFPIYNQTQGTLSGTTDMFITKLDPSGTIIYSTYLGGSADEAVSQIVVDSSGYTYANGWTLSTDFPTSNAAQGTYGGGDYDGFLVKLNSSGAIQYSTYLGGSSADGDASGLAIDSNDNLYFYGNTKSTNFPTSNAAQGTYGGGTNDEFLTQFDSSGNVTFSTYLGGTGIESVNDIAIDSNDNIILHGSTDATDFLVSNAAQGTYGGGTNDLFITQFDNTGTILYSTYLGGSNDEGYAKITIDSNDNLYVTGSTSSSNFPTASAAQGTYGGNTDGFLTKFNSSGAIQFSTFLGGTNGEAQTDIDTDSNNNIFIKGVSSSSDFPTSNAAQSVFGGSQDATITKFNASGSILFSTYLGGSSDEDANGYAGSLITDSNDYIYIAGSTTSTDFPVTNSIQGTNGGNNDAYVVKMDNFGSIDFSTYLGGLNDDYQRFNLALDSSDNLYLTGTTSSCNFPIVNAAQSHNGLGSESDAFMVKMH